MTVRAETTGSGGSTINIKLGVFDDPDRSTPEPIDVRIRWRDTEFKFVEGSQKSSNNGQDVAVDGSSVTWRQCRIDPSVHRRSNPWRFELQLTRLGQLESTVHVDLLDSETGDRINFEGDSDHWTAPELS